MSAITLNENLLTFAAAAKLFPPISNGRPVASATLWRWARIGARRRDGTIVRLEHTRVGGRSVTSAEAVQRFLDALNADAVGGAA